ncbi:hypothetical protein [Atlantibacter sp.]|uniref:hypothetical protein n=1 Tax=Atlantibacter sp. TaxID=1903473 RepID=UPI0028A169E0|nr:hypothetical protein [Atlantibacter sp.]
MYAQSESFQQYWYPGSANNRYIFNFSSGVLEINSPGFPLVPEDTENFGNVITLPDGSGYSLLGRYLMDSDFKVVSKSEGIFDNLALDIANCAFAPETDNLQNALLYFIDVDTMKYAHITHNTFQESVVDVLIEVPLALDPAANSPLSIQGDTQGHGNWLFYITQTQETYALVCVFCQGNQTKNSSHVFLPPGGVPVSIDIQGNRLTIVRDDNTLDYGTFIRSEQGVYFQWQNLISNLTDNFVQSAFSKDGTLLFYTTDTDSQYQLHAFNVITGTTVDTPLAGHYFALKRGPDNIIYGLSRKGASPSTLLAITPTNKMDEFSISEILTPANGGFFPSTAWVDLY